MMVTPMTNPICRECERPMTLLGSWAGSLYVPQGGESSRPITSRHYLCDACQIPLRVEFCPAHQKRLVIPPLGAPGVAGIKPRPQRCPSLGCTYEKARDEAPLPVA
jgi:hypothetical protein